MWIGGLFIVGFGIYLAWCLVKGKIYVTLGPDLRKQTQLVDRNNSPLTFWIAWSASMVALVIFTVYLARTLF